MPMKDVLRYIVLTGTFMIPFIPLVVAGSLFFPYITGKNFTFRIIVEIMAAAWVALMLMETKYRPKFSWIMAALGLFTTVLFVANLLSDDVFRAFWSNFERMEGWVTVAHLFLYFVISVSILNTEKLWRTFWNTSLAAAGFIGLLWMKEAYDIVQSGSSIWRASINFGNPTYLAIYNVFHIFIAATLLLDRFKRPILASWYGYVILIQLVMLYYTATRGTMLGLIAGVAVTGLLVALFERKNVLLRKIAIGAVAAVVVLVGGFYLMKDTSFVRESPVLNRFATISLTGGTGGSRIMIWNMAYEGFQERPLLGWGQEGFVQVFNKYYDPNMYRHEPWFDRTHNVFFDWLIAGGIIGFIAYFTVPAAMLYYLWFYKRPDQSHSFVRRFISSIGFARHDEHPMSIAERALWTGLLGAYLVHNLFVFDNLTSYLLYIAMLAYIHVRVTMDDEPIASSYVISKENAGLLVFPVALAVMVSFAYYANVRPMMASANMINGLRTLAQIQSAGDQITPGQKETAYRNALEMYRSADETDFIGRQEFAEQFVQAATRVLQSDAPQEVKEQFADAARTSMERQIDRQPNDARTLLFMGSFLGSTGSPQLALEYLERARESSPTKQSILFEVGSRQLGLGNVEEGVAVFEEAFHLAPQNLQAREYYALGLIFDDRTEEAVALFVNEDGTLAVDSEKYFFNDEGVLVMDDDRILRAVEAQGQYELMLAILESRLARDPSSLQAHVSLAAGLNRAGNAPAAIETIEAAIALDASFEQQGQAFIEEIRSGAAR